MKSKILLLLLSIILFVGCKNNSNKKASNWPEIKTPITIFAAHNDILFPGKKMLKRAKRIFTTLKESELISDSKHVQNKDQNLMIEEVIIN